MAITNREVGKLIEERVNFTTGNKTITGTAEEFGFVGNGAMPLTSIHFKSFASARERKAIRYVVLSYETPVAWLVEESDGLCWIEPQSKYSVTTSKHMGCIRGGYGDIPVRWI